MSEMPPWDDEEPSDEVELAAQVAFYLTRASDRLTRSRDPQAILRYFWDMREHQREHQREREDPPDPSRE